MKVRLIFIITCMVYSMGVHPCQSMSMQNVENKDYFVSGSNGIQIFVRKLESVKAKPISAQPLLMVRGGGPGALASFDLDVAGGSLAKDLAEKGLKVFIMNIRGWERSTLPKYDLSDDALLIGTIEEAIEDIGHVVDFICAKERVKKVSLFGWATGGHWIGGYTSKNPAKVANFISLNSLYSTNAPWELRQFFQDSLNPMKFNRTSLFRESTKGELGRKWTATIPIETKEDWRDPTVFQGYLSFGKDKTVMKVPGAYREESFYMSLGKSYWNASSITCPSLILRTKLDFWSRPEDLIAIEKDLINVPKKVIKEITGTHYVFLDRQENGRESLIQEIFEFLTD